MQYFIVRFINNARGNFLYKFTDDSKHSFNIFKAENKVFLSNCLLSKTTISFINEV